MFQTASRTHSEFFCDCPTVRTVLVAFCFFCDVCACIHDHILKVVNTISDLINRLWELHQIYNLRAVGDKDELIDFEVKGQGYSETTS